MHQFFLARAFCGTRICCSPAVGCSGTIQKIHTGKMDRAQGREHAWKYDRFYDPGMFDEHLGPFRAKGSALTRNVSSPHGSKNMLQKVILYRHDKYYSAGKIAGPDTRKVYVNI